MPEVDNSKPESKESDVYMPEDFSPQQPSGAVSNCNWVIESLFETPSVQKVEQNIDDMHYLDNRIFLLKYNSNGKRYSKRCICWMAYNNKSMTRETIWKTLRLESRRLPKNLAKSSTR